MESKVNRKCCSGLKECITPIRNYFQGKTIFLTGGTGFLGQLFLEKLLRIDVKKIYILIRPKKTISITDRIKTLFSSSLFTKMKEIEPNYLDKIHLVEGDLKEIGLSLLEHDLEDIIQNVEIVLHAAADVRFDESLKDLVLINVRGTREILKISERIINLQVFAYISTAYSHCYKEEIDETFYTTPIDPETMIAVIEKYSNDPTFEILEKRLIQPWPNTYTYTKSLSEEMVRKFKTKFSICVIRPTIIIATHEDPFPAWFNNVYGLNGILIACGIGVLRLMVFNKNLVGDIVCADFVTNSTLTAIWATYEDTKYNFFNKEINDPKIYHVSSSQYQPITWGEICNSMTNLGHKNPPSRVIWRICTNSTICPFMQKLLTFYYHLIPGVLYDFYFAMTKSDKRLMPLYRKVHIFQTALKYFMTKEWKFTNTNTKQLINRMPPCEQEFFPSDVQRYNWNTYNVIYLEGIKRFVDRGHEEDPVKTKILYRKFFNYHYVVLFFYYSFHCILFYYIAKFFGFSKIITSFFNDVMNFLS